MDGSDLALSPLGRFLERSNIVLNGAAVCKPDWLRSPLGVTPGF